MAATFQYSSNLTDNCMERSMHFPFSYLVLNSLKFSTLLKIKLRLI